MGLALGAASTELRAAPAPDDTPPGPPVKCGVIGLGRQGREILASLAKIPVMPIVAICDTYTAPAYIKRSQDIAPEAKFYDDYQKLLADPAVQAVFIATPSHKHKQIAIDAIAAGKHVYCEAPLGSSLDDAKAIAVAGAASKAVFQAGLQSRANAQNLHVLEFVRSSALGTVLQARGQSHRKLSWRQPAASPEREKEVNWRLLKETSSGLPGEIGVHQFDVATWFLKALPLSVTGFGSVNFWKQDGMEVPDTIQCVLEYPNNVRYIYDATLGNSYEADPHDDFADVFMGSDCAILLRDQRAWMFKETDAPMLGWEVYARKDDLKVGPAKYGTGIALVANASKQLALGKDPGTVGTDVTKTSLYQAILAFLNSVHTGAKPGADALTGYQASVVAQKVHEATMTASKITFDPQWFKLS